MREFVFEGGLTRGEEKASAYSLSALQEALKNNTILEAVCYMCDKEQNLHIKLGEIEGIIPKNESAIGVQSGKVKDIALISKVGKPVQFTVSEVTGQTRCLSFKKSGAGSVQGGVYCHAARGRYHSRQSHTLGALRRVCGYRCRHQLAHPHRYAVGLTHFAPVSARKRGGSVALRGAQYYR